MADEERAPDVVEVGGVSRDRGMAGGRSNFDARLWDSHPVFTAAEVGAAIGRDEAYVRRVWRLFGFPDPEKRTIFFPGDVELFRIHTEAAALFGEGHIDHVMRAVGAGTRSILEAVIAVGPASHGDLSLATSEEAEQFRHIAYELLPQLLDSLPALLRHQAGETVDFLLSNTPTGGVEQVLAVAFCDLVDSTPIERAFPAETARALSEFEIYASDVIGRRRARLVKFVGDEVMFATSRIDDAREIAIEVLHWVAAHDHLSLARGGIAHGRVVSRDGDLYGATVNLAARLASAAAPDTLVVADDDGDEMILVKGFDEPIRIRTHHRP
jgi:adenylate cyclase